jgi:hypothetical protein
MPKIVKEQINQNTPTHPDTKYIIKVILQIVIHFFMRNERS